MQSTSPVISPSELAALLPEGCVLLDVREPVEHAGGNIAEARLIPLGELEKRAAEIPRNLPVVVMCHSGKRGGQAVAKLAAMGFTGCRNLEGGMLAWKAAGLPTGKAQGKVLPLMQQVQMVIGAGVLAGVILSRMVHPSWVYLSGVFGAGLLISGATGWCGLGMLLARMPWNRIAGERCRVTGSCSVPN